MHGGAAPTRFRPRPGPTDAALFDHVTVELARRRVARRSAMPLQRGRSAGRIYKAPVDEVLSLLTDLLQISRYTKLPGSADASADVVEPILGEAAKLCQEVVQPLNLPGDREGCKRRDDGSVTTPKGFKDAYRQYAEGGWMGISAPAEFGGQGLPALLTSIVNEMMASASMSFAMYPG